MKTKGFLPLVPKLLLALRYFLIFLIRITSIVVYYSPYVGLLDFMIHYHAETYLLDRDVFDSFKDSQYHYWNPIVNEFQSVNISSLFRSTYPNAGDAKPPSVQMYTGINLRTAYGLFSAIYVAYGILIFLIKFCVSKDFRLASHAARFQHIIGRFHLHHF